MAFETIACCRIGLPGPRADHRAVRPPVNVPLPASSKSGPGPLLVAITETETLIGLGLTERLGVPQTESRGALPAAKGLPGVFGLGVSARNSADVGSAC